MVERFNNILIVELDFMEDAMVLVEQLLQERFSCEEITNYVFRENKAVFDSEISSFKDFSSQLAGFNPDLPPDCLPDKILPFFEEFLKKTVKKRQYPGAVTERILLGAKKTIKFLKM